MAFYLIWTSQTLDSKIRYGSSKKVQNGAENWQNCLIAWKGGNGKISKSFHPLKEILLAYFASKAKSCFFFTAKVKVILINHFYRPAVYSFTGIIG